MIENNKSQKNIMLNVDIATKYYKDVLGIEKVSLKVGPGEIVGLLGDNGSGKTTLLKAMMNFTKLNIGEVLLDGEIVRDKVYKKIAYISNEGTYFSNMTVIEHLDFYKNMSDKFEIDKFNEYIDFFKLPADKKTNSLSKGQRAKLEISLGLSKGADYILMDEPFEGKDIFTREDFLKLMIARLRDDQTVIIATHLIKDIQNFLTRLVILDKGRKVRDIPIEELENDNLSVYDYLKQIKKYDDIKSSLVK